ncbi:MAG TPA: c-type cytochrome [Terriglobales bacterium]|nr:c-type cytochrome [Terriglobales bacterium]
MRTILRASLVFVAVAFAFSTWSVAADSGGDIFKSKCAVCHGAIGAGDTGMGKTLKLRDLGSSEVQSQSDADLTNIITNGKGKMPKYEGKLTNDQINEVVKYVRTLKK